jgi:hypothetical protein
MTREVGNLQAFLLHSVLLKLSGFLSGVNEFLHVARMINNNSNKTGQIKVHSSPWPHALLYHMHHQVCHLVRVYIHALVSPSLAKLGKQKSQDALHHHHHHHVAESSASYLATVLTLLTQSYTHKTKRKAWWLCFQGPYTVAHVSFHQCWSYWQSTKSPLNLYSGGWVVAALRYC